MLVAARAESESYLLVANTMMSRGEPEIALRGYTRALAEDGLSGPVLGGMGAAQLQLDRHRQATGLLERGTRVAPESAAVWNNLGVALAAQGHERAARDAFALAGSLSPAIGAVVSTNVARLDGKGGQETVAADMIVLRHHTGLYLLLERAEGAP